MFIDQRDLLHGMGMLFVKEFIHIAVTEHHGSGDCLFYQGDPASHFYTLIEGEVRLSIQEQKQRVYLLQVPGEMFGWSSLVGGERYTASAVCTTACSVLKFDKIVLSEFLEKRPETGFLFYKKLSRMLGERLIKAYDVIYDFPKPEPHSLQ